MLELIEFIGGPADGKTEEVPVGCETRDVPVLKLEVLRDPFVVLDPDERIWKRASYRRESPGSKRFVYVE